MEMGGESPFRCGSCERPTDDCYILQDGSVVCVECVKCWESDRAKQN